MLLFKRLVTALFLFLVFFAVVYVGSMAIGGGIKGAQMAAQQQDASGGFNQGYAVGLRAGAEFRREYGATVRWAALGVAVVGAVGLSFSGALPWCRRNAPPPLPPAFS